MQTVNRAIVVILTPDGAETALTVDVPEPMVGKNLHDVLESAIGLGVSVLGGVVQRDNEEEDTKP